MPEPPGSVGFAVNTREGLFVLLPLSEGAADGEEKSGTVLSTEKVRVLFAVLALMFPAASLLRTSTLQAFVPSAVQFVLLTVTGPSRLPRDIQAEGVVPLLYTLASHTVGSEPISSSTITLNVEIYHFVVPSGFVTGGPVMVAVGMTVSFVASFVPVPVFPAVSVCEAVAVRFEAPS